jgi:hypothetical protein
MALRRGSAGVDPGRREMRRMTGLLDSRCVAALAAAIVLAAFGAHAGESVDISFSFADGAKSSYDVSLDLEVTTTAGTEKQKVSSSSKTSMKLLMDTVARASEGEPPQLAVTFSGLELDQTITGPAGEIRVEIRGGNVKVEKDSRTVIDTANDLGKDLAGALMAEFGFLGEEGTLVMDPSGRVAEVAGPSEFADFLAVSSGPGLFVLRAPDGPVEVAETWQPEPTEVKRLKGIDLSANPLPVKTSFTLEGVEKADGAGDEGARLARIAVRSSIDEETDISARASTEAVEERHVAIRRIAREASGVVMFDLKRGAVAESELDVELTVEMEIASEGSGEDKDKDKKDEKVLHGLTGKAKIRTKLRPAVEKPEEAEAPEPEAAAPEVGTGAEEAGQAAEPAPAAPVAPVAPDEAPVTPDEANDEKAEGEETAVEGPGAEKADE